MPHKANAARRHHIARPKRRVLNWAEYDAALRQRGSLTVWVSDEVVRHWKAAPRTTPGGQPVYSDLAITAPTQRDRHIQTIAETGRMAWQAASGYNQRAKVEGGIGRWKQVLGPALRFHSTAAQVKKVAIGVELLNRMLAFGRPNSVRVA